MGAPSRWRRSRSSTGMWQLIQCPSPPGPVCSGGGVVSQMSPTFLGHLPAKKHPLKAARRVGTEPSSLILVGSALGSGTGAAESSASVYGCDGAAEYGRGRAVLGNVSGVEHQDVVGDISDDAEVVSDEHVRVAGFALMVFEQIKHLGLDGDVEGRDGLIGDDEIRVSCERAGERDPLLLTAAELAWPPIE